MGKKKKKIKKYSAITVLNSNFGLSTEEMISQLRSSNVEAVDSNGAGILHRLSGPADIIEDYALGFDRIEVAKAMIESNPKILDSRWNGLDLPIEWAVRHGDSKMFEALLPYYKDKIESLVVDDRHIDDVESNPPSILKFAMEDGRFEICKLILQSSNYSYKAHEVDFIISNYDKMRTFVPEFAKKLDDGMEQFLDDLRLGRYTLDFEKNLLIHRDANGNSLLHHAVIHGDEGVLKALLKTEEGKKFMYIKNNDGYTPLDIALKDLKYSMSMNLLRNVGFTKSEITKAFCIVGNSELSTVAKQSFAFGLSTMFVAAMANDSSKRTNTIWENDLLFHALGAVTISTIGLAEAAFARKVVNHVQHTYNTNNPNAPIDPIEIKFAKPAIVSAMLGSLITSAIASTLMR